MRDETGAVSGVLDTVMETTSTVLSARAADDANARLAGREAFLSSVLKASTDCIKVLDLDGNLSSISEGGMAVMEIPDLGAVKGCNWPNFLTGSGKDLAVAAVAAARAGETSHFEMAADTYAGTPKWWSVSVSPIVDENRRISEILSVSRDHTALKAAREQETLLRIELGHRMKNQLAVVQATASQTLRSATDLSTAAAVLTSRVQVLARAHDTLILGVAGSSDVGEIVRQVLLPHDNKLASQFAINGPLVTIAPRPALSFALILHELSTNAAKYGALSVPTGVVSIEWRIDRSEMQPRFVFEWREHGGPVVAEPNRQGSGSRLIKTGLSGTVGSSVKVEYALDGLRCELAAELASFQSEI